jgi:hypothetical protein
MRLPGLSPSSSRRSSVNHLFAGGAMTIAMQQMLEDIGIGEQAMRYEEFYGY